MTVKFHVQNTTSHPFLLSFLRKPARVEKKGTRYESLSFNLSDIDTSGNVPVEKTMDQLRSQGLRIALETDVELVGNDVKLVQKEAAPAVERKVGDPRYLRNLRKVQDYATSAESQHQSLGHAGRPAGMEITGGPQFGSGGPSAVSLSREAPLTAVPGMRKENLGVPVTLDLDAIRANVEKAAKSVEAAKKVPPVEGIPCTAEGVILSAETESLIPQPAVDTEAVTVPRRGRGRPRKSGTPVPESPVLDI